MPARIARIETRTYRYPLEPAFHAAWDPVPRMAQEATLVLVHADDGSVGHASGGDGLPDRALLERLLTGVDPGDFETVRGICETVDFHFGRPWAVEVACWDLAGRMSGDPVWRLSGGRQPRLTAYASTGELATPEQRAGRAAELRDRGIQALKIRFHHADWREDFEVVEAVRDRVGPGMRVMVDANQGWRMPGDLSPRWDVATAAACARALEPLGIHWLEEPLHTADLDGYAALRAQTGVPIAAGEMVRQEHEARDLITRGGVDVIQCDVLFCGGISGCRRIAAIAEEHGSTWSPHTWSNGYGLLANLHAACGFSTHPYLEVPYDPPAWSAERRDWLLSSVLEISDDGTISAPDRPGLGLEPDLEELEQWRID
jgi:L-alanine-DL-glutamate epimerase-like enolase superfamily enzyme